MASVLIVSEDQNLATAYQVILGPEVQTTITNHGPTALEDALFNRPDVVILDAHDGSSPYDLVDLITQTPETEGTRIFVLLPLIDPDIRAKLSERGVTGVGVRSLGAIDGITGLVRQHLN